jgi:hypothetical protein
VSIVLPSAPASLPDVTCRAACRRASSRGCLLEHSPEQVRIEQPGDTDTRVNYGYRRVHVMMRREGYSDNVKRIYRL